MGFPLARERNGTRDYDQCVVDTPNASLCRRAIGFGDWKSYSAGASRTFRPVRSHGLRPTNHSGPPYDRKFVHHCVTKSPCTEQSSKRSKAEFRSARRRQYNYGNNARTAATFARLFGIYDENGGRRTSPNRHYRDGTACDGVRHLSPGYSIGDVPATGPIRRPTGSPAHTRPGNGRTTLLDRAGFRTGLRSAIGTIVVGRYFCPVRRRKRSAD